MDYLKSYENFLLKNASQITSIESSLRSLTYFLPGRFHDAELASQALYAAINLIGLYHNSILRRAAQAYAKEEGQTGDGFLLEESNFNKYIHFWSNKSKLNATASTALSVLSYTQVLLEMAVMKKFGKKKQWELIATLEMIKVVLRLTLYQTTGQRMTLQPTHSEREIDPTSLQQQQEQSSQQQQQYQKSHYVGQRTGICIPSLSDTIELNQNHFMSSGRKHHPSTHSTAAYTDVTDYLLSKVLTPEKLRKPDQMVQIQKNLSKWAEVLYIFRPLIYVLCILRYGKRSWKPWFISFIAEIASQIALKKGYDHANQRMMPLERHEYMRRGQQLLLLNVMRGAFYMKWTRPRLERLCNRLESKPLLSIASNVLRDYLPLWEQIYFYTSAS
ncbi:peroxisome membrane protein [Mycotypha africana]|uniref:peroxisome membrane protein n=1 Tax=Mycotypha africana TaxID=64632 RepID=UPI0023018350|nr:peroxisome membrane protein [Mycotypha africana]KAI8987954.1 peroxisome membrane protein [Mycotypha africana]